MYCETLSIATVGRFAPGYTEVFSAAVPFPRPATTIHDCKPRPGQVVGPPKVPGTFSPLQLCPGLHGSQ